MWIRGQHLQNRPQILKSLTLSLKIPHPFQVLSVGRSSDGDSSSLSLPVESTEQQRLLTTIVAPIVPVRQQQLPAVAAAATVSFFYPLNSYLPRFGSNRQQQSHRSSDVTDAPLAWLPAVSGHRAAVLTSFQHFSVNEVPRQQLCRLSSSALFSVLLYQGSSPNWLDSRTLRHNIDLAAVFCS